MIEFEGKQYTSQTAIRDEWYPGRSTHIVRRYVVDGGCKTRMEVAIAESKAASAGRAKCIAAARRSGFTKNVIRRSV